MQVHSPQSTPRTLLFTLHRRARVLHSECRECNKPLGVKHCVESKNALAGNFYSTSRFHVHLPIRGVQLVPNSSNRCAICRSCQQSCRRSSRIYLISRSYDSVIIGVARN